MQELKSISLCRQLYCPTTTLSPGSSQHSFWQAGSPPSSQSAMRYSLLLVLLILFSSKQSYTYICSLLCFRQEFAPSHPAVQWASNAGSTELFLAADDLSFIAVALRYHNMFCKSVCPGTLHDCSQPVYTGSSRARIVKGISKSCNMVAAGSTAEHAQHACFTGQMLSPCNWLSRRCLQLGMLTG